METIELFGKPTQALQACMQEKEEENVNEIKFCILSTSGDDRIIWDKRFPDQMKEAQKKFYELIDKGYKLFAVLADGKKSTRPMLRFDPYAEEVIAVRSIIAVPPMRGG